MKKLLLIIMLIISNYSYSQIKTMKEPIKLLEQNNQKNETTYDSLSNFVGENAYQYIGQDLYLLPTASYLSNKDYSNFFKDYTKNTSEEDGLYQYYGNVYKSPDVFKMTPFDSVQGKYFTCINIFKPVSKNEWMPDERLYLQLINKSNGDTVYYKYTKTLEDLFPFIVVGFFEKQKSKLINTEYVFKQYEVEYMFKNFDTGENFKFLPNLKWKCTDLFIDEENGQLTIMLTNNNGEKTKYNFKNFTNGPKFSLVEYIKLQKKFGASNLNDILMGKIHLGMNKEMCKMSWGEPNDINKTITSGRVSEQWVYDSNYLYFDNNVLTAIQ